MTEDKLNKAWGKTAVEKAQTKTSNSFMKLVKGENRVRFLGVPAFINILWHDKKKYIVPESYRVRLESMGYDVVPNVALKVIDRKESEIQLKIIEKKPSVFLPVFDYSAETGEGQGSIKDGQDWKIKVDYPGSDVRKTKYTFMPVGKTPLTKAEISFLQENKIDFDKMYNEEKAIERLSELIESENLESENLDSDNEETSTEDVEEMVEEEAVSSEDEVNEEDLF